MGDAPIQPHGLPGALRLRVVQHARGHKPPQPGLPVPGKRQGKLPSAGNLRCGIKYAQGHGHADLV